MATQPPIASPSLSSSLSRCPLIARAMRSPTPTVAASKTSPTSKLVRPTLSS
jgi:hypothetical protein